MIAFAAVLIQNIVGLTKKYFSYPISVKLTVDHKQELTFPSVTICNMSPIKKSAWQAAQNKEVKSRRKRATGSVYRYIDVFLHYFLYRPIVDLIIIRVFLATAIH